MRVKPVSSPPNIVFIVLDAARADHFSGYGYGRKTTPKIDAISQKGALFLKHFAQSMGTQLSLPSIFSSRYLSIPIFPSDSWEWGVKREDPAYVFRKLDDQQIILPELLSSAGYRTTIFHEHAWFDERSCFISKFDESHYSPTSWEAPSAGQVVDRVLSWISQNKNRKFFIYCHLMSPHEPYPPKKEEEEFLDGESPAKLNSVRNKFRGKKSASARGWSAEELKCLNVLYDGELRYIDQQVGRLYSGLKELGLAESTLFIITSDHGENLGQHGDLSHGGTELGALPWDSLAHTPLVMIYPPLIPAGVKVQGITESIDIMPTVLEACEIELPPGKAVDGVSLLEYVRKPDTGKGVTCSIESFRTEKFKYIFPYYITADELIFDLGKDPGETENIAGKNPLLKKELQNRYDEFMRPFWERYETAIRKDAPSSSFFVPLNEFQLSSASILEKCNIGESPGTVLPELSPRNSWLINTHPFRGGIFYFPRQEGSSPIICSLRLPNGVYQVLTLVETLNDIDLSSGEAGLRARFDPELPFMDPVEIVRAAGEEGRFYYYVDWGKVNVSGESFSIQFDCNPPGGITCLLHHVKFMPAEDKAREGPVGGDEGEQRGKRENLKSLGYF